VRGRKHWSGVAAGLAVALLVAGVACNGDDDDQAGRSTTTEPTTTSTTTTTQPTTTTTPIAGPAPWTDIVRDLFQRDWALRTNPDPNGVASLYSTNCNCYSPFLTDVEGMAARGEHVEGVPPVPIAVMTTGEGGGGFRRLIVKLEVGPQRIVGADGSLVGETPGRDPGCVSILVAPSGSNGSYQIHDFLVPRGCPDGL
jgi:hypothetical protein